MRAARKVDPAQVRSAKLRSTDFFGAATAIRCACAGRACHTGHGHSQSARVQACYLHDSPAKCDVKRKATGKRRSALIDWKAMG